MSQSRYRDLDLSLAPGPHTTKEIGKASGRAGRNNFQHLECRKVFAICKALSLKGFLSNSAVPVTKDIAGMLLSAAGMTQMCGAFFQVQNSTLTRPFISWTLKSSLHVLHAQLQHKATCKGRLMLNTAAFL